jgi:hypothetical protein
MFRADLDMVLAEDDMSLSNVVRFNVSRLDVDGLFANHGLIGARLGRAGVQPPSTMLGVSRLAFPELMVEFEARAVS